jgi:hypothetical protein
MAFAVQGDVRIFYEVLGDRAFPPVLLPYPVAHPRDGFFARDRHRHAP